MVYRRKHAFNLLKEKIILASFLSLPNLMKTSKIECDASDLLELF
jgi:hypothetical protein